METKTSPPPPIEDKPPWVEAGSDIKSPPARRSTGSTSAKPPTSYILSREGKVDVVFDEGFGDMPKFDAQVSTADEEGSMLEDMSISVSSKNSKSGSLISRLRGKRSRNKG